MVPSNTNINTITLTSNKTQVHPSTSLIRIQTHANFANFPLPPTDLNDSGQPRPASSSRTSILDTHPVQGALPHLPDLQLISTIVAVLRLPLSDAGDAIRLVEIYIGST